MNQSIKDSFKTLESLRLFTNNQDILEVVDKFIEFRKEIAKLVNSIESSIMNSILELLPDHFFGLIPQIRMSSRKLDDYIVLLLQQTETKKNDVIQSIKQQEHSISQLKISYTVTMEKSMKPLLELLNTTLDNISNKVKYEQEFTIQRLSARDQGIALETNGILFEDITLYVTVFELKVDEIELIGFHQPILFDGLYYEQGFNSKDDPHRIKYQIHKGFNLSQNIYEETVNFFHPEQQPQNDAYVIKLSQQVKLQHGTYCISATAGDNGDFFGTVAFTKKHEANPIIQFQQRDYLEHEFVIPQSVKVISCTADSGLFPSFIIKQR